MTPQALKETASYQDLLDVSARLGADPLQVQGPGGNTSIKFDGVMWVKASGTWLADAASREIMVPVNAAAIREALVQRHDAHDAKDFVLIGGEDGLRPSIETAFHAALAWPVVLHTHCVATIAVAIRTDAHQIVEERLGDLGAIFVDYVKPGIDLAREIMSAVRPDTRIVVLGNHGLLIAGETAPAAERLLREVSARLDPGLDTASVDVDPAFAATIAGSGLIAVPHGPTQAIAHDPERLAIADGNSLYPDHVIFLGPGVQMCRTSGPIEATAVRTVVKSDVRKLILIPGQGVGMPEDASPSVRALAHAFGDVLMRVDPKAPVTRLTTAQENELLNWDAEKHRQALEAARSGNA